MPREPLTLGPRSLASASASALSSVQVFDVGDVYTVVLARDAQAIAAAIARVPESRRPAINVALFEAYARFYPGWTFALCCFDVLDAERASPLLWWYTPMNPRELFLPALDAHTGDVPDLTAQVAVDHVIVVGSNQARRGAGRAVQWSRRAPDRLAPYVLDEVIGAPVVGHEPNGDVICSLYDVRRGVFAPIRRSPSTNPKQVGSH